MSKAKPNKKSTSKNLRKKKSASPVDKRKWWAALGIFAFAFLLYANTINHSYTLDDDLVCNKNKYVQQGFSGLKDIFTRSWRHGFSAELDEYYRPMSVAGFAVEKSLFGHKASSYHFMNVFYYALGCALLFFVMRLLFRGKSFWLPVTIALLFAAHPLHTEVVASIKSRDEIFAFLGLLGVLYGIVQYNRKNDVKYFVLALASYFFAILSKEAALAFLGVVPLVIYFFIEQKEDSNTYFKKIGLQTLAFLIPAAIVLAVRASIVTSPVFTTIDNSLFAIESFPNRLATAIAMLGKYLTLVVFPHPLSFDYSYNQIPEMTWGSWQVWASLLAYGGLIYLAIKGLKDKNPLAFGIWFFGITFSITSNIFILMGVTFAERLLFVPLLGFCILASVLLFDFLKIAEGKNLQAFYSILGVVILLFSFKTFSRNQVWKSDETLFSSGIITAPNSSRTQSFYGVMHYRKAQNTAEPNEKKRLIDISIKHLQNSIDIYPGFTETYQHLGQAYEIAGNIKKAEETYLAGFASDPKQTYFPALLNLGALLVNNNRLSEAIPYLEKARTINPNHVLINNNLGIAYQRNKQYDLALQQYEFVLQQGVTEKALGNMVSLYREIGDIEKAISYDKQIKALRGEVVQ